MFVFEENQVLNVFSISMSDRQFKNRNVEIPYYSSIAINILCVL